MINSLLHLPLFWATLTIAVFILGQYAYRITGNNPFAQPVLVGLVLIIAVVGITDTSFETYMQGGDYLHQMLGPVVVMLAVPMVQFLANMRRQWVRIMLAVGIGSGVTVSVAGFLAFWYLKDAAVASTMFTKSVTTPIAVAIAEEVGGIPALSSAFVMVTGILGALMIPSLLKLARIEEPQAQGVALGMCAHAIGTARALDFGQQQAAYSAMAMTLTGTLHALVLPVILPLMFG